MGTVIRLRDLGPVLDAYRLAQIREHLMSEISTETPAVSSNASRETKARRRRVTRPAILASFIAVALVGGGAVATTNTIWRQPDGTVAIDGSALRPVYHGRYLSQVELKSLEVQGKATVSANNRELACQGISLYFDTPVERDAYLADFETRNEGYSHSPSSPVVDVCDPYRGGPRFVSTP